LVPEDKRIPGVREVIRIDITKTSKSCGYGVPIMQLINERETLNKWGEGLTRKVHHPKFDSDLRLELHWTIIRTRIMQIV